jgi:hypothetical protein
MAVKKERVKVDKKILFLISILVLIFLIGCTKTIIVPPAGEEEEQEEEIIEVEEEQEEVEEEQEEIIEEEEAELEEEKPTIECYDDWQCGAVVYGEKYCFQGDSYVLYNGSICKNSGTPESYCIRVKSDKLFRHCSSGRGEVCFNGECMNKFDVECNDTDGGKEYFLQGEVLDTNLTQAMDYCSGTWLIEYFCEKSDFKGKERVHCEHGCEEGACIED